MLSKLNIFKKKTKTINNINDLMNLPSSKEDEHIKLNGKLEYHLQSHFFHTVCAVTGDTLATSPYTYLIFKALYSSFEGVLELQDCISDDDTLFFTSSDNQWYVEYDITFDVVAVYPNLSGFFSDKNKADIECDLDDLSKSDQLFLQSFLE